jgi:alpha-tubulin suppressor-like RCC1 family protein
MKTVSLFGLVVLASGLGTVACSASHGSAPEEATPALTEATAEPLGAGWGNTCALQASGTVRCWGDDSQGLTHAPAGTFTSLSVGYFTACAAGTLSVSCWGAFADDVLKPPTPSLPADRFLEVSVGSTHVCALRNDDTLQCWGDNYYGQARPPTGRFRQVRSIVTGSCALALDGSVKCWGNDEGGTLRAPAGTFKQLSAGSTANHVCGIRDDNTVKCWGSNDRGQLAAPIGTFRQVSVATSHSCAISTAGEVACWGDDGYFETHPVPAGQFKTVSSGDHFTCAARVEGPVECWGQNDHGELNVPPLEALP